MAERDITRALPVNRDIDQREADGQTVLGREDGFEGTMRIKSAATVLGDFAGEIECGAELIVGREAEVIANIRTVNLTISGTVQGTVVATGRLRITSSGRLEGDAKVGSLVVQEGGVHLGSIKVHPEGVPAEEQGAAVPGARPHAPVQPAQAAPLASAGPMFGSGAHPNGGHGRTQPTAMDRVKKFWGEFF